MEKRTGSINKIKVFHEYGYFNNAKIYFRIPFTLYFLCSVPIESKRFFMFVRKTWNGNNYKWIII
jgi:predicted small integral membrane protein